MKRRLLTFVKVLGTALLFAWLLSNVDLDTLRDAVARMSYEWVLAGLCAAMIMATLPGVRWALICGLFNQPIPIRFAVLCAAEAVALNLVIPGSVGGEVARVLRAQRLTGAWRPIIASAFADRGLNLLAMCVLVLALYPLGPKSDTYSAMFVISGAVVAGSFATLAVCFAVHPRIGRFAGRLGREASHWLILIRRLFRTARGVAGWVAHSIVIQAVNVSLLLFSLYAVGLDAIPLAYVVFATLVVNLAAALPISVAGFGVRETTIVVMLEAVGADRQTGIAVAALFSLLFLSQVLPGLVVWLGKFLGPIPFRRKTVES